MGGWPWLDRQERQPAYRERGLGLYAGITSPPRASSLADIDQLAVYLEDYHKALDRRLGAVEAGTEMLTEVYVPRHRLAEFMTAAADELRRVEADLTYSTVRFTEADRDTYLPWARQAYACVVLKLHTPHTRVGMRAWACVGMPDCRGTSPTTRAPLRDARPASACGQRWRALLGSAGQG